MGQSIEKRRCSDVNGDRDLTMGERNEYGKEGTKPEPEKRHGRNRDRGTEAERE